MSAPAKQKRTWPEKALAYCQGYAGKAARRAGVPRDGRKDVIQDVLVELQIDVTKVPDFHVENVLTAGTQERHVLKKATWRVLARWRYRRKREAAHTLNGKDGEPEYLLPKQRRLKKDDANRPRVLRTYPPADHTLDENHQRRVEDVRCILIDIRNNVARMSDRELRYCLLAIDGLEDEEIAEELRITERQVQRAHSKGLGKLKAVYRKGDHEYAKTSRTKRRT